MRARSAPNAARNRGVDQSPFNESRKAAPCCGDNAVRFTRARKAGASFCSMVPGHPPLRPTAILVRSEPQATPGGPGVAGAHPDRIAMSPDPRTSSGWPGGGHRSLASWSEFRYHHAQGGERFHQSRDRDILDPASRRGEDLGRPWSQRRRARFTIPCSLRIRGGPVSPLRTL